MQNISPKVQNLIAQYQEIAQRLQTFSSQRMTLEMQVKELEQTVDQLEKSGTDDKIYRSAGSILIQTRDKDGLITELKEQKETLEVRAKSFEKQEKQLKERYDSLQKQIAKELGSPSEEESEAEAG